MNPQTYLSTLRYPTLSVLLATLFVVDLFVPDLIPFVDEILLAIASLLISRLKKEPKIEGSS